MKKEWQGMGRAERNLAIKIAKIVQEMVEKHGIPKWIAHQVGKWLFEREWKKLQ